MAGGLHCYLDRFEGDLAVLLIGGEEKVIDSSLLPRNASEGDHLVLSINIDTDARDQTTKEISDLHQELETGESKP